MGPCGNGYGGRSTLVGHIQHGADLQAGNGDRGSAGENRHLLTDISKLHKNHMHKLDNMVDDIGKELQVIKFGNQFRTKVERVLAQINTDEHKLRAVIATFERKINSAYDQKKNLHQGHLVATYCTKICTTLIQLQTKIVFPLYEVVPLPIHFHFSANISVGPDVGRANLIAIGDTETFKTLSSSDLAGFRRLGQTFSCLHWAMTLAHF